jgi:hypothetical protein
MRHELSHQARASVGPLTRQTLGVAILAASVAACIIVEDHGPVGSAWNRTSEQVVVSYRTPDGAAAGWTTEVRPGQKVLLIGAFQAFAREGCLPGTMVATSGDRVVAEARGLCGDDTWQITEPGVTPVTPLP